MLYRKRHQTAPGGVMVKSVKIPSLHQGWFTNTQGSSILYFMLKCMHDIYVVYDCRLNPNADQTRGGKGNENS